MAGIVRMALDEYNTIVERISGKHDYTITPYKVPTNDLQCKPSIQFLERSILPRHTYSPIHT